MSKKLNSKPISLKIDKEDMEEAKKEDENIKEQKALLNDNMASSLEKQMLKLSLNNSNCFSEKKNDDLSLSSILRQDCLNFEHNDFQKIKTLGKGNGGQVEQVIHKPSNHIYALKKIILLNDPEFKKYLTLEIKALLACYSNYIVKYNGAFYGSGTVNVVLEYMDIGSVASILKKVKQIVDVVLGHIAFQILQGLNYMHKELKIIHRDIKPANILLNSKGEVKIADLGICGKLEHTKDVTNSWVGTLAYMSPERLNEQDYSFTTDIWSLGLFVLECTTGKHPFGSESGDPNIFSVVDKINNFQIPEKDFPEKTSSQLKDFVSQCLMKDPEKRPSAEQLLQHDWIKRTQKIDPEKFISWVKFADGQQSTQ